MERPAPGKWRYRSRGIVTVLTVRLILFEPRKTGRIEDNLEPIRECGEALMGYSSASLCGYWYRLMFNLIAGWSSLAARQVHILKVGGPNPSPATNLNGSGN